MKLFYQLSELDQNNALQHCVQIVLSDMLEDGIKLEPINDEEQELKNKLDTALEHIRLIPSREDKISYLLADPIVSGAVYDIAGEMVRGAYFHDENELVIFPNSLIEEEEDEPLLLEPAPKKDKKISTLN